ncbi:MAG: HIT domain-containing protein [Anaerolineae bacterium]|nr:HIT domain-containing protein [Anaerolineae bacterium]
MHLGHALRRALLWLARSRPGGAVLNWALAHMSDLLPVRRLRETETLIAFYHPQPSYRTHILLVPKGAYASLMALPADATDLMRDLLETVQALVRELGLEGGGYRLIVNGGTYQEVPHLHFHLVSERESEPTLHPKAQEPGAAQR